MIKQKVTDKDVVLSKTLSKLLRHKAVEEGLNISTDGFVSVNEILQHRYLKGKYRVEDIERVVRSNDKQRFFIQRNDDLTLEIRANQGHSMHIVENLELQPILLNISATDDYDVIHGTYYKNWNNIKKIGLSHMNRLHIHFARGLPHDDRIISGIRKSAQIYIYVDLKRALNDGIPFYKSSNDVILSTGNAEGIIENKYFLKVIDSKTGREMFY